MKRIAFYSLSAYKNDSNARHASSDRIAIDDDKLYLTCVALHGEQKGRATPQEKKFFGVDEAYTGNCNGDLFEFSQNLVWKCNNPKCSNKYDCKKEEGLNRFLKYSGKDTCPWCGSEDIEDYEMELFQYEGELLAKDQQGNHKYLSWENQPVNLDHNDKNVIGKIESAWAVIPEKAIHELLAIDKEHERIVSHINSGRISSGSMELLTSIGFCSKTFKVHLSEDEFSDHLKKYKGMVDPDGHHVFEICKGISGCGHAILSSGNDPADSKAHIREVLASKNKSSTSSQQSLNTMSKPEFSKKADIKPDVSKLRRPDSGSEAKRHANFYTGKGETMNNMMDQLKAFGNYDPARSDKDVRLAMMSPEDRAEYLEFEAHKASKGSGNRSPVIASTKSTLRPDGEFVMNTLKAIVTTKKIATKTLVDSLISLGSDKIRIAEALSVRTNPSNALKKLSLRKSQVGDEGDIQEIVLDTIADSLLQAADAVKNQVNDVTYEDVGNCLEEISETPTIVEEELNNFDSEEGEDVRPETIKENSEDVSEDSFETPDKEANTMKKEAQDIKPMEPTRSVETSETPGSNPKINTANDLELENEEPKRDLITSETPGSEEESTLVKAYKARKASLEKKIASGDGDFDVLVKDLTKVIAQIALEKKSISTELGIDKDTADNLGGSAVVNPKAVPHVESGKDIGPEKGIDRDRADELGGNGIDKNPKAVPHVAQKEEKEQALENTAKNPLSSKVVTSKDIAELKEMGILPSDTKSAQAKNVSQNSPLKYDPEFDESAKPEKYPVAKDGNQDKAGENPDKRKVDLEVNPGNKDNSLESRTAQADSGMLTNLKQNDAEKGQGIKTAPGDADKKMFEGEGLDKVTELGKAEENMFKGQNIDDATVIGSHIEEMEEGEGKSKDTPAGGTIANMDEGEGKENLTKIDDTYPDAQSLKQYKLKAQFIPAKGRDAASKSAWVVYAENDPIFRISLAQAYPGEVVRKASHFASEDYADSLVAAIRTSGLKEVHTDIFFGEGKVYTAVERKAIRKAQNAAPAAVNTTQTQQPANVDQAVSDKIMNDAKPGLGILDILAGLLAPIIVESDTLSASGAVEELVSAVNDQDKITELTTKLDSNVNALKQAAGLPSEGNDAAPRLDGEAAPSAVGVPAGQGTGSNGAPNLGGGGLDGSVPQQLNAMASLNKTVAALKKVTAEKEALQKKYDATLATSRALPLVRKAQELGIIDNYNTFRKNSLSRTASKKKADTLLQAEVNRVIGLPEDAYLEWEKGIKTSIHHVAIKGDAKAVRIAKIVSEGGAPLIGILPMTSEGQSYHQADTNIKATPKIAWTLASHVNKDAHTKDMQKWDNRNTKD